MIYVLEDDKSIRNLTVYALESAGLAACGFEYPSEFWKALEEQIPSMLLLDVMLPEEDGISILVKLRAKKETASLPVIMLTAKSSEFDKVQALDSGADDYVTKPFGMMELVSRIKALMRRSRGDNSREYSIGNLVVSPGAHVVKADGQSVTLTLKEFELLCLLLENRGKVISRDTILQRVWGFDYDGENRTVDVHIRTLRSKLGSCGALVETVRGVGYKIG